MLMIQTESVNKQSTHGCKCGKSYPLLSTLYNHIKTKHNKNKKDFYLKQREKGRPAKETDYQKSLRLGFVPKCIDLININATLNLLFPHIQNGNLKKFIIEQLKEYQKEITETIDKLDETSKTWFNQSEKFFKNNFGFFLDLYDDQIKDFIDRSYQISLIRNVTNTNEIVNNFRALIDSAISNL